MVVNIREKEKGNQTIFKHKQMSKQLEDFFLEGNDAKEGNNENNCIILKIKDG